MQFVVPIPLWLYVIFVLIVVSLGFYIFAFFLALGFLYFLITSPKETLSLVFTLVAWSILFKYWQFAVPITIICLIISCVKKSDKVEGNFQNEIKQINGDCNKDQPKLIS